MEAVCRVLGLKNDCTKLSKSRRALAALLDDCCGSEDDGSNRAETARYGIEKIKKKVCGRLLSEFAQLAAVHSTTSRLSTKSPAAPLSVSAVTASAAASIGSVATGRRFAAARRNSNQHGAAELLQPEEDIEVQTT